MKTKWILIGCGKVILKNKNCVFQNKNNKIVGIKTTNKKSEEEAIKKLKLKIKQYNNLDYMINNLNYDAIYICTPPKYHYEYLKKLCNVKKPIIVEKPFLLNYNQCINIHKKFPKKNIYAMLYKGSSKKINFLKKIINKKKYGEIYKIEGNFKRIFNFEHLNSWIYNKNISGGGRVFDIIEHILETLYSLFSDLEVIDSKCIYNSKYHDCESQVFAKLKCGNIPTFLNFDMESDIYIDEITLYSKEYKIKFSVNDHTYIYIYRKNKLIKTFAFKVEKYWGIEITNKIKKIIKNRKVDYIPNIDVMLKIEKCVDDIIK